VSSAGSSPILSWEFEQDYPNGRLFTISLLSSVTDVSWSEPAGLHVVRVRACNSHGCGPWGSASATVRSATPTTTPPRPPVQASVSASGGVGSLSVSWSVSSAGSSRIRHWELEQDYPNGRQYTNTYTSSRTSVSRSGQLAGHHVVRVRACNTHGCGPWGSASATVRSATPTTTTTKTTAPQQNLVEALVDLGRALTATLRAPGQPSVNARVNTASDGTMTFVASWTPPSDDGGSPITEYTVQISRPGRTFGPYDRGSSDRSFSITGAIVGRTYTSWVQACNRHGCGPWGRASATVRSATPTTTVPQIRQSGDNAPGTSTPLNSLYRDLYTEYVRMNESGLDCDSTTRTSAELRDPWRTTWATATTNGSDWKRGNELPYHFPIGECTSWVEFRLWKTGANTAFHNGYLHEAFGGKGAPWSHARNWDDNAESAGVSLYRSPTVHSVAQWDSDPLSSSWRGHVAFVEAVSDDGNTIWVSEMNNGEAKLCYLKVRRITRSSSGSGVNSWPDNFISLGGSSV